MLRHPDKFVEFMPMQGVRFMSRFFLFAMILLLISACTAKPRVGVDVDANNKSSNSRILFSQPF